MIRENVKKNMDIISAFAEGKTIQYKTDTGSWHDLTENEGLPMGTLAEEPNKFRIKPEQKFRSFKDAEECWAEMLKHQPFEWIKGKTDGLLLLITAIVSKNDIRVDGVFLSLDCIEESYTFADGTPFGVKVEE